MNAVAAQSFTSLLDAPADGRGLDEVTAVKADFDDVARITAGGSRECEYCRQRDQGDAAAFHVSSCMGCGATTVPTVFAFPPHSLLE